MRIILSGAAGKMGKEVAACAKEQGVLLACGVDECESEQHPASLPCPVFRSFAEVTESADAVIDFSSPSALKPCLDFCLKRKIAAVIATTGLSKCDDLLLSRAAEQIPVFQSENFSLGICLLDRLVKEAATFLQNFDIEIVERHHAEKKDAPSGTALLLAKNIQEVRGGEISFGRAGKRKSGEICVHAIRGGTLVGEHEVSFAGTDEVITLVHSARSRKIFALGALRAAQWLCTKPAGRYSMEHLLI